MLRRLLRSWSLLALPLAFGVAACSEDLETGAVCPALCPGQEIVVFDTVLTPAYVYDSTLVGFPSQGLESPLFLALRGDSLDVRAIVRFDTAMRQFRPTLSDTLRPIVSIDSAFLQVRLRSSGIDLPSAFTVEVYDVFDPGLDDSLPAQLIPFFTPARLMGTYVGDSALNDSLRVDIPLDTAYLRAVLADTARRVRFGLQVKSAESVQLEVSPYSTQIGDGPTLRYWVLPDSSVGLIGPQQPFSETPATPPLIADDLADYQLVVTAPNDVAAGRFTIGGLPGARAYLRFDLPRWLTDSVGVLKADLELVQDPVRGLSDTDTLFVNTHLVLAGFAVTEPRRAATLLSPADLFTPTLRLVPSDSGVKLLPMGAIVRNWRTNNGTPVLPTALVLRAFFEGATPQAVRFFGFDAADPALRPKLRVSYTPNTIFGRP